MRRRCFMCDRLMVRGWLMRLLFPDRLDCGGDCARCMPDLPEMWRGGFASREYVRLVHLRPVSAPLAALPQPPGGSMSEEEK